MTRYCITWTGAAMCAKYDAEHGRAMRPASFGADLGGWYVYCYLSALRHLAEAA